VARIERLRRVDGERVALIRSYLPERLVPGVDASAFGSTGRDQSILYVLEHRFGLLLDKGEETLLPTGAAERDAELLGVETGTPVAVRICRIDDVAGAPSLYEEAIWCAPQTQLVQRLAVAGADPTWLSEPS
jgi:GntR family transcriptional regulator